MARLFQHSFSAIRVLGFPPGVGVLLIIFNCFHNHIVENLARINEGGRFTKPNNGSDKKAYDKYDNDLFQTGRLVTCGLYVNIILKDYVRTILDLNHTNSSWDIDPRANNSASKATGNQVSAEFNLLYRWHACISDRDAKWTEDLSLLPRQGLALATFWQLYILFSPVDFFFFPIRCDLITI
jgi:linoleate 8R-lipoxygenase/9,12-octadecadienoate 8-hydroperoxide 8R-isomerase